MEFGYGIDVDGGGNVYLTGETNSADFPTHREYGRTARLFASDAYVCKLFEDTSGACQFRYSTYLGGSSGDVGNAIVVNDCGEICVTGWTFSSDFPTRSAFQPDYAGTSDVFVTMLSPFLPGDSSLIFSSYLGGAAGQEIPYGLADFDQDLFVTGLAGEAGFPLVDPLYSYSGQTDAFVSRIRGPLDADGDGVCEFEDNCPLTYNPQQADYDQDGIGDVCDPCSNLPPAIVTTSDTVLVQFNQPFSFTPVITDPDDVTWTLSFPVYPHWCIQSGDTITGTAPDTAFIEELTVIAEDVCNADTASFWVQIFLCGDLNNDGFINLADITHLISYVYLDGEAPSPEEAANVNGSADGKANLADITYLINYVYLGGNDPVCPE
jgi:hypothetical protein